jgi:hypothetical protein
MKLFDFTNFGIINQNVQITDVQKTHPDEYILVTNARISDDGYVHGDVVKLFTREERRQFSIPGNYRNRFSMWSGDNIVLEEVSGSLGGL